LPHHRSVRPGLLLAVLLGAVAAVGCSSASSAPPVPTTPGGRPDVDLAAGRAVWVDSCARCHGPAGKGGAGPKLAGVVTAKFPDPAAEVDVIRKGRGGMPSFGDRLTPQQIDAVVRYTREVL
jgi:mono/diheme cytochrome c family protein